MRLERIVCLLLLSPVCAWAVGDEPAVTLRDAVEVQVRGGWPNFRAKLEQGKTVRIAYLGGSITAQKGWRVQSSEWFQKQYPQARVEGIDAAIGGTGSDLGVFRVNHDALSKSPDLLFVEFAVNDDPTPSDTIRRAMEGIVRQTRRALPECDLVFVYTLTGRKGVKELQEGKMKRTDSIMEEVAEHYGIPSIELGMEVAKLAKDNKLVMSSSGDAPALVAGKALDEAAPMPKDGEGRIVFSKDGIHPYPQTGHVLYTEAIIRAAGAMAAVGTAGPHALPAPLMADNWEGARMIPLSQVVKDSALPRDKKLEAGFGEHLPEVWTIAPGESISFKFRGRKAAIYDLLGPDGAALEITVDGETRRVERFDRYCTSHRISMLPIADNLSEGEHEVRISVLADKIDKVKILTERGKNPGLEKLPEKYEAAFWHPGALLVLDNVPAS